jgi:Niemann-Pick C1 protein
MEPKGTSLDFSPLDREDKSSSLQSDLEDEHTHSSFPEEKHTDTWLQEWMDRQFVKLGTFVVKRPWQVIALSIFCCLVMFAGVFSDNMVYENRSEYLWVPTNSLAYKSFKYNDKVFPQNYYNLIIAESESKSDNFLTKAVFDSLWQLDTDLKAVTLNDGTTYADICRSYDGKCLVSGPLNFWEDFEDYNSSVFTDADVISAVSASYDVDGFPMSPSAVFGKHTLNATSGELIWAYGTTLTYLLDEDKVSETKSQLWEDEFLIVSGVKNAPGDPVLKQRYDSVRIYPLGYRSLEAEMTRVVTIDVPLVMLEYVAMFIFVGIAVSYGQSETKISQAVGCIMSVIMSTMSGYGLCAFLGIPMTQLVFILPFILVGIGVDDGVVIISSYRHLSKKVHSNEEDGGIGSRLATALGRCSLSIVYTTGTDVAAFSLGCLGTIPAIRYFCAYAAVSVALDFVFQVTYAFGVL